MSKHGMSSQLPKKSHNDNSTGGVSAGRGVFENQLLVGFHQIDVNLGIPRRRTLLTLRTLCLQEIKRFHMPTRR